MKRGSLRTRLALGTAATLIAGTLLASLPILGWSYHSLVEKSEERVQEASRRAGQIWDSKRDEPSILRFFHILSEDPRTEDVSFLLLDTAGGVIARDGHPLPWPNPPAEWKTGISKSQGVTIVAGVRVPSFKGYWGERGGEVLEMAIVVSLFGGMAAWVLVGLTLRPIGALSVQALAASEDALYSKRISPPEATEMASLVETLNEFLDRLRDNTRRREQFYASAAHELRTPLAVLSMNVEVSLSRPREAEEYRKTLEEIQSQTALLIKLAEDLLTLNRLNTGADDEPEETVDVADICERMIASLAPRIADRGLEILTRLVDHAEIEAPQAHVTILLRNLLENAIKYTPTGGWIEVSLTARTGSVHLTMSNFYPDVDKLDFVRLFDPFYRGDTSRSVEKVGNGLGLPICRRLADSNGWLLTARSMGDSIRFEVEF